MHIEVQQLSADEMRSKGVFDWPVWTKEISIFEWHYDTKEECYILEGDVEILDFKGVKTSFREGDFVTFPKGLTCTWVVKKPVRKHYRYQ